MQRKAFICSSWHKHRHTQVSDSNRIHCLISFLVSAVAVFFPSYSETDCDCERVNNMNIEWYMAYGHAAADDECEKRIKITSILWYVVFKHLIQYICLNGCNKSTHTHTLTRARQQIFFPILHRLPFEIVSMLSEGSGLAFSWYAWLCVISTSI